MATFRPVFSALKTLNQYHTKQLFYQATRKNVFMFKMLQNVRLLPFLTTKRSFSSTPMLLDQESVDETDAKNEDSDSEEEVDSEEKFIERYLNPKDRTRVIPPEASIKYMESVAFKSTYGSDPVWKKYRRNFAGSRLPLSTRETCIRSEMIVTGSPCPICRDEYLVIDYRNKELLKQFVDPYTGKILHPNKTHICQKQWRNLKIHMEKAKDHGYIDVDSPQVEYDYNEYKKQLN